MYIPQDSPLVLHVPTSWQLAHLQVPIYCCRGEVAGITRALRISVSQMLYELNQDHQVLEF